VIRCAKCGKDLEGKDRDGWTASISGSIMGDEYTDSYFFCESCGVYTVEVYRDSFLGEGEASTRGPLSGEEGDAKVRLIGECPEPWDKKCRCNAHLSYFQGLLD
jgi:hypothetical protein